MNPRNVPHVTPAETPDLQGNRGSSGDGGNRTHATFPTSDTGHHARRTTRFTIVVDGRVTGKGRPRFNSQTKRTYTPRATVVAENRVVNAWVEAGHPRLGDGPLRASIVIVLERPQAHWTSKGELSAAGKRAEWPVRKPDVDNVIKLLLDPLNKRAYNDDAQIVDCHVVRRWAHRGEHEGTILTLQQIEPRRLTHTRLEAAA